MCFDFNLLFFSCWQPVKLLIFVHSFFFFVLYSFIYLFSSLHFFFPCLFALLSYLLYSFVFLARGAAVQWLHKGFYIAEKSQVESKSVDEIRPIDLSRPPRYSYTSLSRYSPFLLDIYMPFLCLPPCLSTHHLKAPPPCHKTSNVDKLNTKKK